jgi:hypothetical protein
MLSLAGGTFQGESVENSDPFSIDSDNARIAQFTQGGGDGLAIDVQVLRDFFVRQVFDTFPLDPFQEQAGDARHQGAERRCFEIE